MRKISAHFMINGGELIPSPLVTLDSEGVVIDVQRDVKNIDTQSDVEFYNGVIIPGMVNSHCHLEYSYVYGKIPEGGGLPKFISTIISIKINDKTPDSEKARQSEISDALMYAEGVVAIGDHNNNDYVYEVKQNSKIYYHSFIEMYDMDDMSADQVFELAESRVAEHASRGLKATIAPHATYTMDDRNLALCGGSVESDKGHKATGALSIHFKESVVMAGDQESERVFSAVSPDRDSIIFVHNIYITPEDVDRAVYMYGDKLSMVVCPLSNYYIEDAMTDIDYLRKKGVNITVGTDSLSSNHKLSMVAEMKFLQDKFPHIPLTEIVKWATENGAKAIGMSDTFGKIEKGMKCGIVNIAELDLENMRLTDSSKGIRLI